MPVAGAVIHELTDFDRLCFTCEVPGGCDEEHPFCARKLFKSELVQRRAAVIRHLMDNGGEVASAYFVALWDEDQRYVSRRIMGPLKARGYIERVNGDGPWAEWRLGSGNATSAS